MTSTNEHGFGRSRRRIIVLALMAGLLGQARATDYYMTLTGAGAKNGSDWANAFDASTIQTTINTTVQPGDTLYLGGATSSGGATYGDKRFTLSASGTSSAPKRLIGVDLGYGMPQFVGIQTTRSYTTITLADTVSYWTIKNIYIGHRDVGLATSGAGHLGLVIDGVIAHDIRSACFSFADCDNIVVKNCRAERYSSLGFMFVNSCDGVTVQNCVADCTGTGATDDPAWRANCSGPVGFNFHVKNSTAAFNTNILLEDCESLNNDEDTADTSDYEQGDGFKTEASNQGVTLVRCKSYLNQDAAYDLKGADQTLQDCIAVNNKRYGFKVWYDGELVNCASVNNGARQLTIAAGSAGHTVYVDHCTFHCASTSQSGAVIETAGNTVVMTDSLLTFASTSGTYTAGPGTFSLTRTSKLSGTSNSANSPAYNNPVLPWDGEGDDFDNQVFGPLRGYNSLGLGVGPATLILDDTDTTGVAIAGSWTSSTSTSGYFGSDYLSDGNTGKGTKSVTYTPTIPASGLYAVYAWWTAGTNRATNTPVSVVHAAGTANLTVDQTANGGKWVLLGTYSFNAGTAGSITLSNTGTTGYVIADAVKLVDVTPAEVVMDDADASGVTITGAWTSSTFDPNYYGTDYLHDGNTGKGAKSVTFTPTLPVAGSYEVFARWTAGSNRASNTPIAIAYVGGTANVQVDQRSNGGVWVSLGIYSFAAGTGGSVTIGTTGTTGYVIADAVRFVEQ